LTGPEHGPDLGRAEGVEEGHPLAQVFRALQRFSSPKRSAGRLNGSPVTWLEHVTDEEYLGTGGG